MNSVRFLKLIIILLLLINIGTLSFMWMSKPSRGYPPPPPNAFQFLVADLGLTPQQEQQYVQLRNEHHEAFEVLRMHGHDLRNQLFMHLGDTTNNMQIEALADSIAANQKNMDMLTFNHFRKLRALCTHSQQVILDNVIGEALDRMGPPPPGPPPPPRQ